METRRDFIRQGLTLAVGGALLGSSAYAKVLGANDKIRVGIVGFSQRVRSTLIPAFMIYAKEMNMEIVAVSDIWSLRRDEAVKYFKERYGINVKTFRNNEEMYDAKVVDAVIISTADFQHPLHLAEAVNAGMDVYCEKPFAETMDDAQLALKAAKETGKVIQIGSQRRSSPNYIAADQYIKSGKFGPITMVEMCWNVNQPERWRLPDLVAKCRKEDTDWKRFLMNRPYEEFDPRKYCEYRLFWPYSSGIPGQWMSHQIDTVNWFSGYSHPRSVIAGGGVYWWKDGRSNFDTATAVLEYGDADGSNCFQVLYSSRFHNSTGGTKEVYFSNGGTLNLATNEVTPEGGLEEKHASKMGMQPNQLDRFTLPSMKIETASNTGVDLGTSLHMKNWMDCLRSRKQTNAPAQAGYNHAIATIMTNASLRTGEKATFDEATQQVIVGGKVFKY